MDRGFDTPVVLLVFNRPALTAQVFEAVRAMRPRRLLVVADGPRAGRADDAERCREVRAIVTAIDWPCTLSTDFSDVNLGCGQRISSGVSWAFEQVEEAIFLEDDCLPAADFFPYCAALLERYRHDERIGIVSGTNPLGGRIASPYSYSFTRYLHIWGWASWRRTWRLYDFRMQRLRTLINTGFLADSLGDHRVADHFRRMFLKIQRGRDDTWDYQFQYTTFAHSLLNVEPRVNLISNIGFGHDSRSPNLLDGPTANLPTGRLDFPLHHPPAVERWAEADRLHELHVLGIDHRPLWKQWLRIPA